MPLRVAHVALWVEDLEAMRAFYEERLGGRAGGLYHNPRTGFRSYFVAFGEGARVELMAREGLLGRPVPGEHPGYAHVALSAGSAPEVDALVAALEQAGVRIQGRPRTTGDGYYEAVVLDPEGNRIEITA